MNTSPPHRRPAHASPLLWASVVALGLVNIALKIARVDDLEAFADRNDWTWLEFAVGMVTLILIGFGVVSYLRARRTKR